MREGQVLGVTLPERKKQQCISQYADDFSFLVRGGKPFIDEFVHLLGIFSKTSRTYINWHQSSAF